MRSTLLLLLCSTWLSAAFAQAPLYFPPLQSSEWETFPQDSLGWCPEKVDSLLAFAESKGTKSLLILKDGRIALEAYFGSYTADSLWYWASAGKSLMGVMVGLAQEDGHLAIQQPVSDFMGEGWSSCPPEKEALIQIFHQITMTTGLDDSIEEDAVSNCLEPECFQYLADAGERWAYHNAPYRFVQDVVEEATGLNLTLFTRLRLGNRIGMKGAWFNYIYFSTARDMARFGLFNLAEGRWGEDQVMTDTAYHAAMRQPSQPHNPAYGYLWWLNGQSSFLLPGLQISLPGALIPEAPTDMYAALGANDQKIYVVPSQNLVVVRQGLDAGGVAPAASSFDNELWSRLSGLACNMVKTEQHLPPRNTLSVYPNPATEFIQVSSPLPVKSTKLWTLNGRLAAQWGGQLVLPVSQIPDGLYLLQTTFNTGKTEQQQVLIIH